MNDQHTKTFGPIRGIVLLGGGELLRQLSLWAISKNIPLKVITSPRHGDESINGVCLIDFLTENQVEYISVEKISDDIVLSFLSETTGYFYLSLGAAWIFKKELIASLFNNNLFNLHGTRLPQNRGGGGFSWQIMMGNRFGNCVLHYIDGGIDTGDIVAIDEFIYPATARIPYDYEQIYLKKNLQFVIEFIEKYKETSFIAPVFKQLEWFSTYWPRLNTELNGYIDWKYESLELERFICAFDSPYKGASTFLGGKKVFLKKVSLTAQDSYFHPFQAGIIYRKSKKWVCVAINGSSLIVEEVFDEYGNDILNELMVGDRFFTPQKYLEDGLNRPIYTPKGLKP